MSAVLGHETASERPESTPPVSPADTPAADTPAAATPVPAPPPPSHPHHAGRSLSRFRKAVLFAAPAIVTVLGWGVAAAMFFGGYLKRADRQAAVAGGLDGARLYAQNCANCHGTRGDGNGTTLLNPRARYFGKEKFKLASTENGIPTDDDLFRVIRRGIPGSAMPAFPLLTDDQVRAIAGHVRFLARNGIYERLLEKAKKEAEEEGSEVNVGEVRRKADALAAVGRPLPVPAGFTPTSPDSVLRGRQVYLKACVSCHGPEGRGDGPQVKDLKNEDGTPTRPRDLTAGMFKGGGEKERLYTRIMLGIPGTPMPASNTLPPREIDDLLNYVLSLAPARISEGPDLTPAAVPAAR